jgi:HEAT repeat protein
MKRVFTAVIFLIVTGRAVWADDLPPSEIEARVDSLFVIASAGELRYRDKVEPAIDSIAAMGAVAVPRLIEKYTTQDARERLTINNILVKIGAAAVPFLVASLSLEDPEQVSRICYSLGEIKDSGAVSGIIGVASHKDWRVRSNAASALGQIGDNRARKTVMLLLQDSDEMVRKSAAVSSGLLTMDEAIPYLVHMLGDDFYGARLCASESLVKYGPKAIPFIADSLDSENEVVGNLGCTTLGLIGGDPAAAAIAPQLKSDRYTRRALAVEAVLLSNSSLACGEVEILLPGEKHPVVVFLIHKVMDKYASR